VIFLWKSLSSLAARKFLVQSCANKLDEAKNIHTTINSTFIRIAFNTVAFD